MTREEAIKEINRVFEPVYANYIVVALTEGATVSDVKKLPSVNPQEPCDDVVSRQALLEFFKDDDYVVNEINNMPSVLPKREKGEWCEQNDDYFDWYECSECGYGSEGEMQYSSEHDVRTRYCPNCGAEMR